MRLELVQKGRKASAGQRGFKGKVLLGRRQLLQTRQHDAARLYRHCVGVTTRQTARDVVRIHESVNVQRRQYGVCVRPFAFAIRSGDTQ